MSIGSAVGYVSAVGAITSSVAPKFRLVRLDLCLGRLSRRRRQFRRRTSADGSFLPAGFLNFPHARKREGRFI